MNWRWLGHAAALLRFGELTVYVNPVDLSAKRSAPADVVLYGNPRPGFYSSDDLSIIRQPDTVVVGPADLAADVPGLTVLEPGEVLKAGGLQIQAIAAYTVETSFFPREKNWLGFLVSDETRVVYHAGATDRIPEMAGLRADVAFLPVCGRYVMGPETACRVADEIGAEVRVGTLLMGDRYLEVPGFSAAEES